MKRLVFIFSYILPITIFSQTHSSPRIKVLLIGNSYVYVNNLPAVIIEAAASTNNEIIIDTSVPGGYTLKMHSKDSSTINKIKKGIWDYVVLQEQSQLPASKFIKVETDVLPYAHCLDSTIHKYNPNCKTVFYMTWGRKNGDSFTTPFQTYQEMDSLISIRYMLMAKINHAILSPAGVVWNYIRKYYPEIELYSNDGSHPSEAGTYATACCFNTIFFKKDPTSIKFNSNLNNSEALKIRQAVKEVVFNHLSNWYSH